MIAARGDAEMVMFRDAPMSADVSALEVPDRSTRTQEPARSRWRDSRRILADHYATEIRLARQLAQHAECLSGYPDASGRLRVLAARTDSYREVLAHTLERTGGCLKGAQTPVHAAA